MSEDEKWMQECLLIAGRGSRAVAPNPMVGAVLVKDGKCIAQGYHERYGSAHAEVNAVASAGDITFEGTTLYVSLEPCSHFGKTPPCADLILEKKIPRVVIGALDSNPLVAGKGIARLRAAGVEVIHGVLETECRHLNRRFFTHIEKRRPYITLKWAQSQDGFLDHFRTYRDGAIPARISGDESRKAVHQWRAEEMAILVGTNTALLDDPQLTVRFSNGNNPVRVLIDKWGRVPFSHRIFDDQAPTLVFTAETKPPFKKEERISINFNGNVIRQVLNHLHERNIHSVLVEGGSVMIQGFLDENLWDEARVLVAPHSLGSGVPAPRIQQEPRRSSIGEDELMIFINHRF